MYTLLISILLSIAIYSCTNLNKQLNRQPDMKEDYNQFQWGPICEDSLSIGLFIKNKALSVDDPIEWQWAIKNTTMIERSVTVQYDEDIKSRYRLQIFKEGSADIISEFLELLNKSNPSSSLIRPPLNIVIPPKGIHIFDKINSKHRLAPGNYTGQVLFGGSLFNFQCNSAAIAFSIN